MAAKVKKGEAENESAPEESAEVFYNLLFMLLLLLCAWCMAVARSGAVIYDNVQRSASNTHPAARASERAEALGVSRAPRCFPLFQVTLYYNSEFHPPIMNLIQNEVRELFVKANAFPLNEPLFLFVLILPSL